MKKITKFWKNISCFISRYRRSLSRNKKRQRWAGVTSRSYWKSLRPYQKWAEFSWLIADKKKAGADSHFWESAPAFFFWLDVLMTCSNSPTDQKWTQRKPEDRFWLFCSSLFWQKCFEQKKQFFDFDIIFSFRLRSLFLDNKI